MNIICISGFNEMSSSHYIESTQSFETSALLISVVLLGKYIESRTKHRTTNAITKLARLQVPYAICIEENQERETDTELLEIGCICKVYPGSSIPVDGIVTEGEAWINESMMTGESSFDRKTKESFVFGGTICSKGSINVKASKVGKDTALSHIISLVENAQSTKPAIQAFADKISSYFVPVVILLACITWCIWFSLIYGGNEAVNKAIEEENDSAFIFGFKFGISVLVVACPCALGLATPTAVMVATGVAARLGILIKGGDVLESSSKIKTIIFDKTGTLTEGKPKVLLFNTYTEKFFEEEIFTLVQSVESKSEHALAKSICNFTNKLSLPCIEFNNFPGEGVSGLVEIGGKIKEIYIGNIKIAKSHSLYVNEYILTEYERYESDGRTVVIVFIEENAIGLIVLAESEIVKPEAPWVISKLHEMGLEVWIITGDNEKSAKFVAESLNIPQDRVLANCYPADKKNKVESIQSFDSIDQEKDFTINKERHEFDSNNTVININQKSRLYGGVMFVGDGVNDSPSLAQADIGIAIGGTEIANEAADIVLLKTDLKDVLIALDLSKKALSKIKWNLFWAFIYNICGIPLAAGVLFIWTRIQITSIMAAAAMACSSTAVVLSSLLLNRYKPPQF